LSLGSSTLLVHLILCSHDPQLISLAVKRQEMFLSLLAARPLSSYSHGSNSSAQPGSAAESRNVVKVSDERHTVHIEMPQCHRERVSFLIQHQG
ncbi:uncharacterized, partial [Tachysurus ichikawai]